MSIVLEKVIKDSQNLYNMKLIAGEKGLKNIVQWVHVVEEYNMNSFLGGNEIILTTGIACDNGHSLLDFVKMLYKCDVSAIIVNIGPHIHEVTKDVIDYCNEKSVPIFTMPWEVRIEEVTRDFCRKIVNNENIEKNIVSIFKDMIFEYEDYTKYSSVLERNGFRVLGNYTIIAIGSKNSNENVAKDRNLKFHIEKIIHKVSDLVVVFAYKNYRIIILCDYLKDNIDKLIINLKNNYLNSGNGEDYVIGVGSLKINLGDISKEFKKTIEVVKLGNETDKNVIYYDEIGIYKILLEAKESNVLNDFYKDILEPIEKYDKENNTSMIEFIKKYLENNGSVQAVAEAMFVHRNTVNYQINKIKKITGKDLGDLEVKLSFLLCTYIKNIL